MDLFQILVLITLIGISSATPVKLEHQHASSMDRITIFETLNLTVPELIQSEGYPVEVHTVTTTDGYILTVHRIPTGKNGQSNGKVAFVQHGLLSSSADWLISGSDKALGYMLADAGYDVWMGNARGNTQSRKHISLNPDKDSDFWKFSWHEIGIIDLPQMIDYVLESTGVSSVYYVGHSQGTTTLYVMTSMLPEYNEKITVSLSLAPIAYMNHMTSPLMKIMAFWDQSLSILMGLVGFDEFLPHNDFINLLADTLCNNNSVTEILCTNAMFALCGFSQDQMNNTLLPILMSYTPAGSSTRQALHYAQEINSGKFRQYDFGAIENLVKYGSIGPPDYPLSEVTVPAYLIYSQNDWLSAAVDVAKLCSEIANCQEMITVSDLTFNHLDYLFGIDAHSLVYDKVIDIFNRH